MKARPILFSGPMVRALLSGTKTQTRRVVKTQPSVLGDEFPGPRGRNGVSRAYFPHLDFHRAAMPEVCPYGQPGDRLWVRETWQRAGGNTGFWYAATDSEADEGNSPVTHWRPSIHMPRAVSRITLEIAAVRVERLGEITPDDCIAEGAWAVDQRELGRGHEAVAAFRTLWESINGPGSWASNPWVWVLEFRLVEWTRPW